MAVHVFSNPWWSREEETDLKPLTVNLLGIQGDSKGKLGILGCDKIGHYKGEKKIQMNMCLTGNGYRDSAFGIYK